VPLNYARHTLRALTLWLFSFPFSILKDLNLLTGPVVFIVGWLLFGVYEIGVRIEDPFQGTLRLSIMCDTIRRDVLADESIRSTAFDLEHPDESGPGGSTSSSPTNMNGIDSTSASLGTSANVGSVDQVEVPAKELDGEDDELTEEDLSDVNEPLTPAQEASSVLPSSSADQPEGEPESSSLAAVGTGINADEAYM
jgi:Bestrophin, RFP-TM, chloride channel